MLRMRRRRSGNASALARIPCGSFLYCCGISITKILSCFFPDLLWNWRSSVKLADKNTRYIRCYTLFSSPAHELLARSQLDRLGVLVVILMLLVVGFVLAGMLAEHASQSAKDLLIGSWCIGMVVLPLSWLISIPISQMMAIHPANPTQFEVTLKRVSPAFVEAVHHFAAESENQARAEDYRAHFRRRRRDGDDDRIERL